MVRNANETFKTHAYNVIRGRILSCELQPGAPISEQDLIKELGISRTPIREALNRLEAEHLVTIYPKRGIFVTEVSIKDIMDIYMLREAIEPIAARLAATNMDFDKLKALHDKYYSQEARNDLESYIEADLEFHKLVAESTGNMYLEQILKNLYAQNSRIRIISKVRIKEHEAEAWLEVTKVIEALMDRDPSRAEDLMKKHIRNGNASALKAIGFVHEEKG
ncbi:MAG TPA: GntR family transcriptional regulator [Bacillota bacterium]|nr:GntR family transcriptional regulator [Bacillota bacterium]HOG52465.1 GntR family transcriptional regulator [Bacillota bacterium]